MSLFVDIGCKSGSGKLHATVYPDCRGSARTYCRSGRITRHSETAGGAHRPKLCEVILADADWGALRGVPIDWLNSK
jgi:hypothetical protein